MPNKPADGETWGFARKSIENTTHIATLAQDKKPVILNPSQESSSGGGQHTSNQHMEQEQPAEAADPEEEQEPSAEQPAQEPHWEPGKRNMKVFSLKKRSQQKKQPEEEKPEKPEGKFGKYRVNVPKPPGAAGTSSSTK